MRFSKISQTRIYRYRYSVGIRIRPLDKKVALALGDYQKIRCHSCIGGTSVREDIDKLKEGQHVVVGTPGRVYDMLSKRHFRLDNLQVFVLDEADEMLSRGFKDQIYDIFKCLPPNVQVSFFCIL